MELTDYLRVLRRNWHVVTGCILLGLVVAGTISFASAPTYTSQTKLFTATQNSNSVAELQQGNTFTQARIQSYAETATTPLVLQPVIDSLGLDITAQALSGQVDATTDIETVLLTITATDRSPVQAAAIAQAVANSLVEAIEDLETTSGGGESPVKLSVVTPATVPVEPSSPNNRMNLLLGGAVGTLAGLALSLGRATLDTRVRGEADIRRVKDVPVLGGISFDGDANKKPLLTQAPVQSPRAEFFRQIRTNLQFAHVGHDTKAILVTSSLPGEGKSTTAVNLAIAISQAGHSVVLVDADLRRPRINEYLGLERNAGLTTALIGRADVDDLLQPWGEDELYVLTAGQIPPNPSELLGSQAMKHLISGLEDRFDSVIIDAPPLLPVTDAAVLAQQVGGVVMIIGSSKVRIADLHKSFNALEMVGADLLGVVMNLLPSKGPDAYAYTYYASDTPATKRRPASKDAAEEAITHEVSDFDEQIFGSTAVTPERRRG